MASRMPLEIEVAMIEAYEGGLSQIAAAAKFGYSGSACADALRRNGKQSRSTSETSRKYFVNEHFFDKIGDETSAYWLGFISADAGIYKNTLQIDLALKDMGHLEKIKKDLDADYPVTAITSRRGDKTHAAARIKVNSCVLAKALRDLGVTANKTLSLKPNKDISDALAPHYWRGLIDGDGSIIIYKNKHCRTYGINVVLLGTRAVTNGFSDFVSSYGIKTKAIPHPCGKIFRVEYRGRNLPEQILNILYQDASVFLDRKMKLFERIPSLPKRENKYQHITAEALLAAYCKGKTWKMTACLLKIPETSLHHLKDRLLGRKLSDMIMRGRQCQQV